MEAWSLADFVTLTLRQLDPVMLRADQEGYKMLEGIAGLEGALAS